MLSEQPPQSPFSGMPAARIPLRRKAARAVEQFLRSHLPDWVMGQQQNSLEAENTLTVALQISSQSLSNSANPLRLFSRLSSDKPGAVSI